MDAPSPRTQSTVAKKASGIADAIRKNDQEQEERSRQIYEWVRSSTREQIQELVTKLENGKMARINGQRVYPSSQSIQWFENQLKLKPK